MINFIIGFVIIIVIILIIIGLFGPFNDKYYLAQVTYKCEEFNEEKTVYYFHIIIFSSYSEASKIEVNEAVYHTFKVGDKITVIQ